MNDIEKKIARWNDATQDLANIFTEKYHPNLEAKPVWLKDEMGGIYRVGKHWWVFENMIMALSTNANPEHLFLYHDYDLAKCHRGEVTDITLKEFLNTDNHGRNNILEGLQETPKEELKKMLKRLLNTALEKV